jgi:hypothetical protein
VEGNMEVLIINLINLEDLPAAILKVITKVD